MVERAFLGTGLLGSGMAEAAAGRGDAVSAWNRTASKAAPLADHGVRVAPDAAAAIQGAKWVHIVLTNDAAVDAVLEAILPHMAEGQTILDHSTTLPDGTRDRAARLAEAKVPYLHAPVFMSPASARACEGTIIVAGDAGLYAKAEPVLAPMAATVAHVGDRSDAAAAMKLFGNAMNLSMLNGLADIFAMARSLGFSAEDAMRVFDVIDVRYVLNGRGRRMAAENFDPLWTVDIARKDIGLMRECAGDIPQVVLPAIHARLGELQEDGLGEVDVAVVAARPLGVDPKN